MTIRTRNIKVCLKWGGRDGDDDDDNDERRKTTKTTKVDDDEDDDDREVIICAFQINNALTINKNENSKK